MNNHFAHIKPELIEKEISVPVGDALVSGGLYEYQWDGPQLMIMHEGHWKPANDAQWEFLDRVITGYCDDCDQESDLRPWKYERTVVLCDDCYDDRLGSEEEESSEINR